MYENDQSSARLLGENLKSLMERTHKCREFEIILSFYTRLHKVEEYFFSPKFQRKIRTSEM